MKLEKYTEQLKRLPKNGRQIIGRYYRVPGFQPAHRGIRSEEQ